MVFLVSCGKTLHTDDTNDTESEQNQISIHYDEESINLKSINFDKYL